MKEVYLMRHSWMSIALVVSYVLFTAAGQVDASTVQTADGSSSYDWHAELVAFDEGARTITLKSATVGDALKQLAGFKPADKIVLTWSGFDKYANAVNGASKHEAGKRPEPRFAFPAEFVAVDSARAFVTFKMQIPANSVARVKSIKSGEWVTVTSPHGPLSETQPISRVRGYNDPDGAASR